MDYLKSQFRKIIPCLAGCILLAIFVWIFPNRVYLTSTSQITTKSSETRISHHQEVVIKSTPSFQYSHGPFTSQLVEYKQLLTNKFAGVERGVTISLISCKIHGYSYTDHYLIEIPNRLELYLNDKLISKENILVWEMGEPGCEIVRISWVPELEIGYYEARYEFLLDSGEIITHIWSFTMK